MAQRPSQTRAWLTRRGVRTYSSFRSMPIWLRFLFMVGCGSEATLVGIQLKHLQPTYTGVVDWLYGPHPFSELDGRAAFLLLLLAAYTAWLLLVGWGSSAAFRTCKQSLEGDLFG